MAAGVFLVSLSFELLCSAFFVAGRSLHGGTVVRNPWTYSTSSICISSFIGKHRVVDKLGM